MSAGIDKRQYPFYLMQKPRRHQPPSDMGGKQKYFSVKTSEALKADLERSIAKHEKIENMSEFFTKAAEAFILQMRQGRPPAVPLEFIIEGVHENPPDRGAIT